MAVRDASAEAGLFPLILYSHPSMFHRRAATFLCTHLSSQGYVVAALDHSEVVAKELGAQKNESPAQRDARLKAAIDSRVPDLRFLLESVLNGATQIGICPDASRIGVVGHSFGGWTALAVPDVEKRINSIVALAPGGASNPRPGILPATLAFDWNRDIPTLYLVAENDECLPLSGMYELFERTPARKRMVILKRSDHAHFMDLVEEIHEWFRTMPATGDIAAIQKDMLPITELCSGKQAYLFVQGLTLCHLDATLKEHRPAQDFLEGDLQFELGTRGVDSHVHPCR
jgi:dienelactone hydrolase